LPGVGRRITFQDIPVEPWRDGLLERSLPVHLAKHLATIADLHHEGRYDRMSDDVLTLTGQAPTSGRSSSGSMQRRSFRVPKSGLSFCGRSHSIFSDVERHGTKQEMLASGFARLAIEHDVDRYQIYRCKTESCCEARPKALEEEL